MATIQELLGDAPIERTEGDSSFTKGLRSGVAGLRGQLTAAAGGAMEGLGAPNVARELYRTAEGFNIDAAEAAPPVQSYKDVHDLRSAFDYTTGLLGQSAPTVVPAVAGALIAKRPILGSTATLAVPEAGDVIQRQQADPATAALPVGERNLDALLGGGASAAVQSVVPGAAAGRIAGKTAKTAAASTGKQLIGRSAVAVPVEGLAEAGGEAIKEVASGQPLDSERIIEAGVGGAVAGGALGAAGGVGEALHGAAARADTTVRGMATDTAARAGAAVQAAGEGVSSLFKRATQRDDLAARAVKADDLVGVEPGVKPGDADAVAASDAKATEWAKGKVEGWINDAGLDQETRAKANDLMARIADPAARAEIATMDLARKASDRAADFYTKAQEAFGGAKEAVADHPAAAKVRNMLASMQSGEGFSVPAFKAAVREMGIEASGKLEDVVARVKAAFDKPETAKSEDYRGARAVVGRTIMQAIQKTNPELLDDAEAMDRVADGVRRYVAAAKDGKDPHKIAPVTAYLRMFLGADTIATLDRVYTALHKGTKEENAAFYRDLNAYDEAITGHTKMRDTVSNALVDKEVDADDAVEALRRYVRGDHVKQLDGDQRVVREKLMRRELEATFGKNTDKVLAAFEQEYEASKPTTSVDAEDTADLAETDLEPESPRVYRGKGKTAVPSLAEHRRVHGDTPSQVDRLMERARKENPDRNVSFITARDFERAYGEKMDAPDPDKYGAVVVEGSKQEGRITESDARKMLLDSKAHAGSKSRINTDQPGITLDAYKITQQSIKGLPYIEGESGLRRIARAFFDGLGSALIAFDAKPDALGDGLVIAVRNGAKITYGDVKSYKGKGEYSITAMNDVESEIKDLKRVMGKQTDPDKIKFLLGEIAKLEQREASTKDIAKPYDEVQEVDPTGNVHAADKAYGERMGSELDKAKNADQVGAPSLAAERKTLEAATGKRHLSDITVNVKLRDDKGNALVWKGDAKDHPGRMPADKAMAELHDRRETLKKLMSCLKG